MSINGKKSFEAIDTDFLLSQSKEQFEKWISKQNKNILYSRLLELEKKILLHPRNIHHLFLPVTDDIIASPKSGIYGKIYVDLENNPENESPDLINSLLPQTQVKNSIIFVGGKFGVGIVALSITNHGVFQADSVPLEKYYTVDEESVDTMLRFVGLESNYSLNNYTDESGNIITEFLSQLATTQMDNVKNPVGIKLGINNQTLNVIQYLVRRGVSPEIAIALIKQPLIKEYLNEQKINESIVNKSSGNEVTKLTLIGDLLEKYGFPIKESVGVFPSTAFIRKEDLFKYIKDKNAKMDINQLYYFNYFLELIQQSRYLSDIIQEQTADTKALKNKTGYENVIELQNKIDSVNLISREKMTYIRKQGLLAPFNNAREEYDTNFNGMYITNHPDIKLFFNYYKMVLTNMQKTNSKKEKAGVTFENDFILYFTMKYIINRIEPNYYNKLFGIGSSEPSLAERVQEAKETFPNNLALKAFLPLLKTRIDEFSGSYINNLKLFEREINNVDMNDIINSMKEIAETDFNLYRDLVIFSLMQSGINNSPFNYLKVIPEGLNKNRGKAEEFEYVINDIIGDTINVIKDNIKTGKIESDISQYFDEFQRNNPWFLRTKAFKGYPFNYTIGFKNGKMILHKYNPDNYKLKEQVPMLGSTYHKRYGLDSNSLVRPLEPIQNEDRVKPTATEVITDVNALFGEREYTPENITMLRPNEIFVFGSNTEGKHGKGAALIAKQKFGAKYGQAEGLQGQSYAIITKDLSKGERSIPLKEIRNQIDEFVDFAKKNPNNIFYVTKLGSSLAGYSVEEIKEQFKVVDLLNNIPDNVIFPKEYEVRDDAPAKHKMKGEIKLDVDNVKQLQTTEDKVAQRLNADFDALFPQYEYFNKEQKKAATDVIANNETPIECKFTPGKGGNKFGR